VALEPGADPAVSDPVRARLAIHEAGHACAAAFLGWHVDFVSIDIRAGAGQFDPERLSGSAFHSHAEKVVANGPLAGAAFLMDWEARRRFEWSLFVTMAGPVCEQLWAPPRPDVWHLPDPDDAVIDEMVRRRLGLSDEMRERLADDLATRDEETTNDDSRIVGLSKASSSAAPELFAAWFREEVTATVRQPAFRRAVWAVAAALVVRGELDAGEFREIYDDSTKGF
jgi:hypothetical protein